MKKLWLLAAAAFLYTFSAAAQFSPYSGYYGETGPDNQSFEYDGKPIIFVFYNNDDCPSCGEAIELIEQVYNENYQGIYDFYLINYESQEENGNYNFAENYNLTMPLTVVFQYVENGRLTKYQSSLICIISILIHIRKLLCLRYRHFLRMKATRLPFRLL